jgi:RNA polymerase sigma factor (sigma-70 family)
MLGSFQDAEDALQDTLLAAWQGLRGFEGRASIRTWLYRIATNRCLNALRSTKRSPAKEWDIPEVEPPEPSRPGEVVWPLRASAERAGAVHGPGYLSGPPEVAFLCNGRLLRRNATSDPQAYGVVDGVGTVVSPPPQGRGSSPDGLVPESQTLMLPSIRGPDVQAP